MEDDVVLVDGDAGEEVLYLYCDKQMASAGFGRAMRLDMVYG